VGSLFSAENLQYLALSIGAKINDLGWPWRAITHCASKHVRFWEPTTKIWMKIDYTVSDDDIAPRTLDSDNIRFMRIFAGYNSGVIENVLFSRFRTLRIRHLRKHYYIVFFSHLSLFHWPQNTWPWMTLNDLKGHFTLYVHYYERPLTIYLLLIYCRLFITPVTNTWPAPAEKCGKRSTERQNIWNPRKICGSSVDWTLYRRNLNK